jgi:hypothetical protein
MVGGPACKILKGKGLFCGGRRLTGMLPVDPAARRDLDHTSGHGRPGTPESGRPAADSLETAALDGDLAGASRSRTPVHETRRDLPLDVLLDAANPNKGSNKTDRGRRRRTSRWGGGRRGCDSGELVLAVQSMGASTSGTAGLLTSCSCSRPKLRRRGGDAGGVR